MQHGEAEVDEVAEMVESVGVGWGDASSWAWHVHHTLPPRSLVQVDSAGAGDVGAVCGCSWASRGKDTVPRQKCP